MATEREVAGIRCGEVLALLSDYVDGDVHPATRARVDAHLRGCDVCERFGGRFAGVLAQVRRALGPPEPADAGVAARLARRLDGS